MTYSQIILPARRLLIRKAHRHPMDGDGSSVADAGATKRRTAEAQAVYGAIPKTETGASDSGSS